MGLRAANPGLHVSYTLKATTGGLDPDAARLLANAKVYGLAPDVVNVMAMDYGVAQTAAQMLADAKRDATGTEATIRLLGLTSAVGITPMIGANDSPHETFTWADAKGAGSSRGRTRGSAGWRRGRSAATMAGVRAPRWPGRPAAG